MIVKNDDGGLFVNSNTINNNNSSAESDVNVRQSKNSSSGTAKVSSSYTNRVEQLAVSVNAKLAGDLVNRLKSMPDVRADKVAQFKGMIERGEYQLDMDKVAKKLVSEAFDA